ncbi:hypothetical protein SCUP234_02331 [Seiridium cupressi]
MLSGNIDHKLKHFLPAFRNPVKLIMAELEPPKFKMGPVRQASIDMVAAPQAMYHVDSGKSKSDQSQNSHTVWTDLFDFAPFLDSDGLQKLSRQPAVKRATPATLTTASTVPSFD